MQDLNNLRIFIRSILSEVDTREIKPTGRFKGYFRNTEFEDNNSNEYNNQHSPIEKENISWNNHPLFDSNVSTSDKDKSFTSVQNLILKNSKVKPNPNNTIEQQSFDKFNLELTNLNSQINKQAKLIKSYGKIDSTIKKKLEEVSKKIKQLLNTYSPNSLKQPIVVNWYKLK